MAENFFFTPSTLGNNVLQTQIIDEKGSARQKMADGMEQATGDTSYVYIHDHYIRVYVQSKDYNPDFLLYISFYHTFTLTLMPACAVDNIFDKSACQTSINTHPSRPTEARRRERVEIITTLFLLCLIRE